MLLSFFLISIFLCIQCVYTYIYGHVCIFIYSHTYMKLNIYITNPLFFIIHHQEKLDSQNYLAQSRWKCGPYFFFFIEVNFASLFENWKLTFLSFFLPSFLSFFLSYVSDSVLDDVAFSIRIKPKGGGAGGKPLLCFKNIVLLGLNDQKEIILYF